MTVARELLLLLLARARQVDGRDVEHPGLVVIERSGCQVRGVGHEQSLEHRGVDHLDGPRGDGCDFLVGHESPRAFDLLRVGFAHLGAARMPLLGIGELLVPIAERIDALRLGDQLLARALDVLDAQRLDGSGVDVEEMLAPQQLVHGRLADRMRAPGAPRQLALEEVLVTTEAHPGSPCGVLDPFGLCRELALEHSRDVVHVGRAGQIRFSSQLDEQRRNLVQAPPRTFQIIGDREQPRQQQLLALVERRERALEQQEDALHGGLGESHGIARERRQGLEVEPHRVDARAQQQVIDLLSLRQRAAVDLGLEPLRQVA